MVNNQTLKTYIQLGNDKTIRKVYLVHYDVASNIAVCKVQKSEFTVTDVIKFYQLSSVVDDFGYNEILEHKIWTIGYNGDDMSLYESLTQDMCKSSLPTEQSIIADLAFERVCMHVVTCFVDDLFQF